MSINRGDSEINEMGKKERFSKCFKLIVHSIATVLGTFMFLRYSIGFDPVEKYDDSLEENMLKFKVSIDVVLNETLVEQEIITLSEVSKLVDAISRRSKNTTIVCSDQFDCYSYLDFKHTQNQTIVELKDCLEEVCKFNNIGNLESNSLDVLMRRSSDLKREGVQRELREIKNEVKAISFSFNNDFPKLERNALFYKTKSGKYSQYIKDLINISRVRSDEIMTSLSSRFEEIDESWSETVSFVLGEFYVGVEMVRIDYRSLEDKAKSLKENVDKYEGYIKDSMEKVKTLSSDLIKKSGEIASTVDAYKKSSIKLVNDLGTHVSNTFEDALESFEDILESILFGIVKDLHFEKLEELFDLYKDSIEEEVRVTVGDLIENFKGVSTILKNELTSASEEVLKTITVQLSEKIDLDNVFPNTDEIYLKIKASFDENADFDKFRESMDEAVNSIEESLMNENILGSIVDIDLLNPPHSHDEIIYEITNETMKMMVGEVDMIVQDKMFETDKIMKIDKLKADMTDGINFNIINDGVPILEPFDSDLLFDETIASDLGNIYESVSNLNLGFLTSALIVLDLILSFWKLLFQGFRVIKDSDFEVIEERDLRSNIRRSPNLTFLRFSDAGSLILSLTFWVILVNFASGGDNLSEVIVKVPLSIVVPTALMKANAELSLKQTVMIERVRFAELNCIASDSYLIAATRDVNELNEIHKAVSSSCNECLNPEIENSIKSCLGMYEILINYSDGCKSFRISRLTDKISKRDIEDLESELIESSKESIKLMFSELITFLLILICNKLTGRLISDTFSIKAKFVKFASAQDVSKISYVKYERISGGFETMKNKILSRSLLNLTIVLLNSMFIFGYNLLTNNANVRLLAFAGFMPSVMSLVCYFIMFNTER